MGVRGELGLQQDKCNGYNMLNWAREYGNHEIIRELVSTDKKWEIIMAYQTMNIMEELKKKKCNCNS